MSLPEFGPAIPASERPQAHALDRAATGIDVLIEYCTLIKFNGNVPLNLKKGKKLFFYACYAYLAALATKYVARLSSALKNVSKIVENQLGEKCLQNFQRNFVIYFRRLPITQHSMSSLHLHCRKQYGCNLAIVQSRVLKHAARQFILHGSLTDPIQCITYDTDQCPGIFRLFKMYFATGQKSHTIWQR